MKAEITFNQLYWNPRIMDYFFRTQAVNTLDELLDRAVNRMDAVNKIDEYAEWHYNDLDDLEEDFYNESVEDLADMFCIELQDDEEEDD